MTQQDKDLLLRDLSARLPYGVILQVGIFDNGDIKYHNKKLDYHSRLLSLIELDGGYYLNNLLCRYSRFTAKPYLRPMSSMTKDEKHEFYDICTELSEDKNHFIMEGCIDSNYMLEKFNWLNAHQFDYRGLIEKNLAIDCTNLNIY